MKVDKIICDGCGTVVARKNHAHWFGRYVVVKPYAETPFHDFGVDCSDGYIPSKETKHICVDCLEKLKVVCTK